MAVDTQQWAVEQPQSRSVFKMSNSSPYVTAQIEKMEKRLDAKFDMLLQRIPGSQVARSRYGPYSNFDNPGWRDHPNLKWDKDQHSRPQFQQQAAMKNMEKQIGQIALQVSERAPVTFPSQTVPNPRGQEECNVVHTLRSGKSYDNRHENSAGNSRAAEQPQTKSVDSGQLQDRSENTAEVTTKTAEHVYEPPMPYPERLKPKAKDQQLTDFMKTLAKVQINLPLIDAIKNIPCASANLMPYSVFKRLGERELKPTFSIIQLADRSITYPRGVIEDVIVKVDNLYLLADFMVLDMDEDLTASIILGCPFLATARTLINVKAGTLTFRIKDQTVVFKLFEASIHSGDKQECMRVDALDGLPSAEFMNRSSANNKIKERCVGAGK
ncbi:uncharacterized protein [Malus domestica]|uniref:uncharacterized protein n=1 Tax=Malus domestica TaxID=3750 RepID=UPI003975A7E8